MSDPKQAHEPGTDPLPGKTRRAIAELRVGILHEQQGDFARAAACYERVIVASGTPPEDAGVLAAALCNMGGLLVGQGDCAGAMPLLERARCLLQEEVDTPGLSYVEFHLGLAKIAQGDVEAGLVALSTAQKIQQACGDIRHLSATLSAKAVVDIRRGRFANAQALLRHALDIQERLEEHEARVHTLRLLGYCLSGQGLGDAAKQCCTQAEQLSMLLSLPTPDASAPGGNGRGLLQ